ncbi:hypothetical protein JW916_00030 [Candidatus Sumerlaeota bacterium]|nr:hypothetical protein [Candidatus Sumerlaeota bacterium]
MIAPVRLKGRPTFLPYRANVPRPRFRLAGPCFLALWIVAGLCSPGYAQKPAKADTLYLRDGSVLTGLVLEDTQGDYYIYNAKCGKLAVKKNDVLYAMAPDMGPHSMSESYIVIDESSDAISTLQRPIPPRTEGVTSFTLLVPGYIENVRDGIVPDVPYESSAVADASKVTIRYQDLSPRAERLYMTTRQKGLLEPTESGTVRFSTNYTLSEAGTIRVVVKFPDLWKVESASPAPERTFEGLVVWEQPLRRQQKFVPSMTLATPSVE